MSDQNRHLFAPTLEKFWKDQKNRLGEQIRNLKSFQSDSEFEGTILIKM